MSNIRFSYYKKVSAIALIAASMTGINTQIASAQDADTQATSGIDEIVITARRRAESLQEVPLSIAVFNTEQLEERGVTGLLSLDTFIPNLSLGGGDNTSGSNVVGVTIRGVGDTQSRLNVDGAVGLYIAAVFVPRLTGTLIDLLDVESVEVLRGPQGTLFTGTPPVVLSVIIQKNQCWVSMKAI